MQTHEIIQVARGTLKRRREVIGAAAGADWQAECIRDLQIVTGLKLDDTQNSCEVSFRTIESGPDDLGPTRAIWVEAQRLASANTDISKAADLLVDHWLTHLPPDRREDLFEALGMYFAEDGVVQARAEFYWARIAAFSARTKPMTTQVTAEAVAKVVMLHELAHYVTHQGSFHGRHWVHFPSGQDIIEIVAQVATESVIRGFNDASLLSAFEDLLHGAPGKYSAHRKVVERLRSEFSSSEKMKDLAGFWCFFRRVIQGSRSARTTTKDILDYIGCEKPLKEGEHSMDLTF